MTYDSTKAFVKRLQDLIDEDMACHTGLGIEGPRLINFLVTRAGSLRRLAKAANLSPTYLSQCRNGKTIISPETFIRLYELIERGT